MVTQPFNFNNPLDNILNSNPFRLQDLEGTEVGQRTIFEQARPDFLQTGRQRDIFSSMFDRVIKDFLGELGTQFRVGQTPRRSFTEFVNAQDFDRQVKREGIGRGVGALVNPARFLFER